MKKLCFLALWLTGFSPLLPNLAALPEGWRLLQANPPEVGPDGDTPRPQATLSRSQFAANAVAPVAGGLPVVRLGYLVPSNRVAQAGAADKLRALATDAQRWYRDQIDQHGFGPKTFRLETEADRVTPRVHVVSVPETDADLRADPYGRTITAAQNAGLTVWTPGEVWFLVPELHLQTPDGAVTGGGVSLGASYGSGDDPGVAMISGDLLAMCRADMFTDDRPYHGQIVAEVGPYPLRQDVTFPWFVGATFSSVCSSHRGAFIHELSHAFGLSHDFRNDANFHGNLMGNGLRGVRGAFAPARYPADYTRLATVAAGALNVSRYFNETPAAPTGQPTVNVTTSGAVTPADGLVSVAFGATGDQGLAFAWLSLDGNVVGETPLGGTSAAGEFRVPHYTSGSANSFSVTVFDRWGNRAAAGTTITPAAGSPRAPQPFVRILPPVPRFGEPVTLDASGSTEPDAPSARLQVEWDLDNTGRFTAAAPGTILTFTPTASGSHVIRARVRDERNVSAVSAPLALHVHRPDLTLDPVPGGTAVTWLSKLGFSYRPQHSGNLREWTTADPPPVAGTGDRLRLETPTAPGAAPGASFQRLQISRTEN